MAKPFNVESGNETRNKIIKTVISLILVAVVAFSLYAYESKTNREEETKSEVQICVHVKGAVKKSGVYYVPLGTRLNDLNKYAGFLPDADMDGVNLAAYLKDGEEVYIPYKGSAEKGAYELNSVTYEELLEIEGVGETYAHKIINYRESHGEFKKVIELKELLGTKVYESIRESFYLK